MKRKTTIRLLEWTFGQALIHHDPLSLSQAPVLLPTKSASLRPTFRTPGANLNLPLRASSPWLFPCTPCLRRAGAGLLLLSFQHPSRPHEVLLDPSFPTSVPRYAVCTASAIATHSARWRVSRRQDTGRAFSFITSKIT